MESSHVPLHLTNFVWFSHHADDHGRILPIAQQMQADGVGVLWEPAGTDCPVNVCVVFLSRNYLENDACRSELDSIRFGKLPYLVVYLEEVSLPQGLAMRIGRSRALFYRDDTNVRALCEQIYEAYEIGTYNPEAVAGRNTELFRKHLRRRRIKWILLILFAVVLLAFVMLYYADEVLSKDDDPSALSHTAANLQSTDQWVLLNTDEFSAYMIDFQYFESMEEWSVRLELKNDTDVPVTFSGRWERINGLTVKTQYKGYNRPEGEYSWSESVEPHETLVCRVAYPALLWQMFGTESVWEHLGEIRVTDSGGQLLASQEFAVYPEGKQAAEDFVPPEIAEETVIYEDDMLLAAYLGRKNSGSDGTAADLFYLCNHGEYACDVTFYAMGSESEADFFSLVVNLLPDEQILIPAYWSESVGAEVTVQLVYKEELMEDRFVSDEIPIVRDLE